MTIAGTTDTDGLPYAVIESALNQQTLFQSKTWLYSPCAFGLSRQQVAEIEAIGQACVDFYAALEVLYMRSLQGKSLLRNEKLYTPWVADYLDRGKATALLEHAQSKAVRGLLPDIVRPDLLITEAGFTLSEMDSVPGGIGLTAFLNELYAPTHGEQLIGAGEQNMVHAFYVAISAGCQDTNPFIAIVVSDEAGTYRPEMEWLAGQLRDLGRSVWVYHPDELIPIGDVVCVPNAGEPQRVDVIYRFWELFDIANISIADFLLQARREDQLTVTPPMRPFQEEKLNLALFHHHLLAAFWCETLPKASHAVLRRIIPKTWVMDATALPPGAVLDGPVVNGQPLHDWRDFAKASKRERDYIIKISGYHETAWGARSVTLGSDSSQQAWSQAIEHALDAAQSHLHIVQAYHKPSRLKHPIYRAGKVETMDCRVRLCPYYFKNPNSDQIQLQGILATLCPADKKIIHGMKDAALIPCFEQPSI